jgi:hypothetical protein
LPLESAISYGANVEEHTLVLIRNGFVSHGCPIGYFAGAACSKTIEAQPYSIWSQKFYMRLALDFLKFSVLQKTPSCSMRGSSDELARVSRLIL